MTASYKRGEIITIRSFDRDRFGPFLVNAWAYSATLWLYLISSFANELTSASCNLGLFSFSYFLDIINFDLFGSHCPYANNVWGLPIFLHFENIQLLSGIFSNILLCL